jgi:hypothetical protein
MQSYLTPNMISTAHFAPLEPETPRIFRDRFDRSPFLLRHELAGHELFTMENLRALTTRMAPTGRVYYDTGTVRVDQKWSQIPVKRTLKQALDELSTGDSWIILKQANLDPAYGPVLGGCIDELADLTGHYLGRKIGTRIMSIVISSPGRVTPYHMDGECNFLLQCSGSKTMYVFDGRDRAIVTDQELERFWNSDKNAAEYKENTKDKALAFELHPGLGLHVPLLFPHWVKNGTDVSVSVSINFEYASQRLPDVYRANYYLRKLGLRPRQPGLNPLLDGAKGTAFRAFNGVRHMRPANRKAQK